MSPLDNQNLTGIYAEVAIGNAHYRLRLTVWPHADPPREHRVHTALPSLCAVAKPQINKNRSSLSSRDENANL